MPRESIVFACYFYVLILLCFWQEFSVILLLGMNVFLNAVLWKSYITFVIHPSLMMAQSWAESTWEITNYGRFINQFPLNIIRSIRQFERINKKICCPVSWGCRIHRVLLCRGVRPPNECPGYDNKQSDGEVPAVWSFGECGVPLHYHRSQVHSGPEW